MVARIKSFAFTGIDVTEMEVEVKVAPGKQAYNIVGLPDKSINEARERVRGAIQSLSLSFPGNRVTVNLTPADLAKEGGHLDLAIALGILIEMGIIPQDALENYIVMGELSLDSRINFVSGILPSAIACVEKGFGLICPQSCGAEALWGGDDLDIIAPANLFELINHIKGRQILARPENKKSLAKPEYPDFADVIGQEQVKRALEIAAAGGHNLLMVGPPGTGKSMLAKRLPGILPDLSLEEILEINIVASIAGKTKDGDLIMHRPYIDPHHSISMPALVGGGAKPKPGQISMAHKGVLFLDELPEFQRGVLDALRQPLEEKETNIGRVHSYVTFPADFQLIAAMNPCRCGHYMDGKLQCKKAPFCAQEYQSRISGPLLDRIDINIDVPKIDVFESKKSYKKAESSAEIKIRVEKARNIQTARYANTSNKSATNSSAENNLIEKACNLDDECEGIIKTAMDKFSLSMRAYTRILRVARTIADLDACGDVNKNHVLEALRYRRNTFLK